MCMTHVGLGVGMEVLSLEIFQRADTGFVLTCASMVTTAVGKEHGESLTWL